MKDVKGRKKSEVLVNVQQKYTILNFQHYEKEQQEGKLHNVYEKHIVVNLEHYENRDEGK